MFKCSRLVSCGGGWGGMKVSVLIPPLVPGRGDLTMLQYARASGCTWGGTTCTEAARHGHLEILKWARANGCPWDPWGSQAVAEVWNFIITYNATVKVTHNLQAGQLEILQWMYENGCSLDSNACQRAAEAGHFEILQWLRAHEAPWDERTCEGG